jgi:hypothetical protein
MPTCILILSDKSSGSSALQEFLCSNYGAKHIGRTRHFEHETLYWTKAASVLGLPQVPMQNSEVPLSQEKALSDLAALLRDNVPGFAMPSSHREMIMGGWEALVEENSPLFIEKSPHHLHQRSALDLMVQFSAEHPHVKVVFVCLIRNPIDTLYSMWTRFFSIPEKQEREWIRAYDNLQYLMKLKLPNFFVIRYEDLRANNQSFVKFLDQVIPSPNSAPDFSFFHQHSTKRHMTDPFFGYTPTTELITLAMRFGYSKVDLNTNQRPLWPFWRTFRVRVLGTIFYVAASVIRFLRKP